MLGSSRKSRKMPSAEWWFDDKCRHNQIWLSLQGFPSFGRTHLRSSHSAEVIYSTDTPIEPDIPTVRNPVNTVPDRGVNHFTRSSWRERRLILYR